ncbi:hypothetical protein F2Q69_00039312 [Brassica cretica]|uniref:Uncharacterized protein n=1 Tax=Brassica cretica TaxID=69181 RepID=A0A8S9SBN8_BRACR|nr:hypothetical protein F2Q69_00039312 [Brassica cretica]
MARSVLRRMGFNIEESIDKVEEVQRLANRLSRDVSQMKGEISKLEVDFAVAEIRCK